MTSRTAVYGPVRTVVWEGRNREVPPYPDPWPISEVSEGTWHFRFLGFSRHALEGVARTVRDPNATFGKKAKLRLAGTHF